MRGVSEVMVHTSDSSGKVQMIRDTYNSVPGVNFTMSSFRINACLEPRKLS